MTHYYRPEQEPTQFLRHVNHCKGDVWLELTEGDTLNLKSTFCQFVFTTIWSKRELLTNAVVRCDHEEDYLLIADYWKE